MPRRSSRLSAAGSSPVESHQDENMPPGTAGTKRKAELSSSPANKRGKVANVKTSPKKDKDQKSLEESGISNYSTIKAENGSAEENDIARVSMDVDSKDSNQDKDEKGTQETTQNDELKDASDTPKQDAVQENAQKEEEGPTSQKESENSSTDAKGSNGRAAEEDSRREMSVPSNMVEKGVIYFLTRARVGVEDPEGPEDMQRSYIVLAPLPKGSKISDGSINGSTDARLLALPKKILPKSHHDRFMAFVEAKKSIKELKEEYFKSEDRETKTAGVTHNHSVTPLAEGVYAITEVGRSTHLLYMTTIPHELGEVQKDMGIRHKGSFVVSVKNPTRKGPASANLGRDPGFPEEIIKEFRGLAWKGVTKPEYLDYANAQILLIGEHQDTFGSAGDATTKDSKNDSKETPVEEIEKLEYEDELRVEHLSGDDSIFDDLRLRAEEVSKIPTSW